MNKINIKPKAKKGGNKELENKYKKEIEEKEKELNENKNIIINLKKHLDETDKELKKEKEKLIEENENYKNKIFEYESIINEYKENLSKSQKSILNIEIEKKKYNEEIEKQKNDFNKAKNEYEKNLKEKYEKEFEKKKEELEKNINNNNNEINKSICKTIHQGIKCQMCHKMPIVGFRYKCSQCKDYNLCQDCEEKNSIKDEHPHDFIKLRKEQPNNNNKDDDNNINNINGEDYSYECLNKNELKIEIGEGEDEANIGVVLKNNKSNKWPMNDTKLTLDNNSNIDGDDVVLEPQGFNQQKKYTFKLKGLSKSPKGEHKIYLFFRVNGEQYGDKIMVTIIIKEKKKQKINDKDKEHIKEFRDFYGLLEDDYKDEVLLEALRKKNYDYTEAFSSLFN